MIKINDETIDLPQAAQKELLDFTEYLKYKYSNKKSNSCFKFKWAGGLKEQKEQYNSVELQHLINSSENYLR